MKLKKFIKKFSINKIRAGYYPVLFILSMLWIFYYQPELDRISMFSFVIQHIMLFSMLQILDSLIAVRKIRYSLAGISAIYTLMMHLDAFLLSITSMTLYESVTILAVGGDFLYTLEEAGLSTGFIFLLIILLSVILTAGVFVYKFMPHKVLNSRVCGSSLQVVFLLSVFFFIAEQHSNRNSSNFFARRIYPLYIKIFSFNDETLSININENNRPDAALYSRISAPENSKNVLFIILESFRKDSINSVLAPEMTAISKNTPEFQNYFTDAIYTSLAWNTLLMDRPAYTFTSDINYDREHRDGSGIFRIFKNAGYETFVAFSANMEWKNFHDRVNGKDGLIDNYYCGYEKRDEERNFIDNRVSAKSAEWIKKHDAKKPFFMMIQLDSTHWTYYADKVNEISKPFAGKDVNIGKLKSWSDIELLLNRYKNSVRQVDSGINKIITALKQSGRYNNTAVVIVSDHGEGFAPGMIGHSVLQDDIKKPAFIMHLPGVEKFKTDKLISHRDLFPGIFDYLKIRGTEKILTGRSIFDKDYKNRGILTFHGSIMMADLTLNDYIVFFRVRNSSGFISFTPVKYADRSGNVIKIQDHYEWKSILKEIMKQR